MSTWVDTQLADALAGRIAWRAPVRAATTANITLSGLQTVDGVALAEGDSVLVKNQSVGSQNGVYLASVGAWKRRIDFNSSTKTIAGASFYVTEGTTNGKAQWAQSTTGPVSLGATSLLFERASGIMSAADKTTHDQLVANALAAAAALTDADSTITVADGRFRTVAASALTADRTKTLATTGAVDGDEIHVARFDRSTRRLTVKDASGAVLHILSAPGEATFRFQSGAWTRKWATRRSGDAVVNPVDFGADPTGVADSSGAMQSALNAAAGGTLQIPAGSFRIDSYLFVSSNTRVIGSGQEVTIFVDNATTVPWGGTTSGANGMFSCVNIANVELAHFTIRRTITRRGATTSVPGGGKGIFCRGNSTTLTVKDVHVHHVTVDSSEWESFYTDGWSFNITFSHCRVINPQLAGYNVAAPAGAGCAVLNCYYEHNIAYDGSTADTRQRTAAQVAIEGTNTGWVVSGNRIRGVVPTGIVQTLADIIEIDGPGFVLANNVVEGIQQNAGVPLCRIGFTNSVSVNRVTNGIVYGNLFQRCIFGMALQAGGILISNVDGPVHVFGNTFFDCHAGGTTGTFPACIQVDCSISDGSTAVMGEVLIEGNYMVLGAGAFVTPANPNPPEGVRLNSNVIAGNKARIGRNHFSSDWPMAKREILNVAPYRSDALEALTYAATTAIDWDRGPNKSVALTGNVTFTFANLRAGSTYSLLVLQDATGSRIATWPASAKFVGTDGTLSTAANATDLFVGLSDGTNIWFYAAKKGF